MHFISQLQLLGLCELKDLFVFLKHLCLQLLIFVFLLLGDECIISFIIFFLSKLFLYFFRNESKNFSFNYNMVLLHHGNAKRHQ